LKEKFSYQIAKALYAPRAPRGKREQFGRILSGVQQKGGGFKAEKLQMFSKYFASP
jgi:hypothetical protein